MEQSSRAVEGPLDATVVPLAPKRVQLSRAKGWRMPENTVKVDRTTDWGNPFIVGKDGTAAECVQRFELMLTGLVDMRNVEVARRQNDFLRTWQDGFSLNKLRGKNLACWCRLDKPCHADVLLLLANDERHNAESTGPQGSGWTTGYGAVCGRRCNSQRKFARPPDVTRNGAIVHSHQPNRRTT